MDLGGSGFPSPFNFGGSVEAESSLHMAARVLHVMDLGGGSFPSPFNSNGSV
jgi:hypothetical protein